MTTIAEENRKYLREAMKVECGFRETGDEPTSMSETNNVKNLDGLANLNSALPHAIIMDLAGNGFKNNGEAIPMETDSSSYEYGYISTEVSKPDGTFNNPMGLTITAAEDWDNITLELRGQYGESQIVTKTPTWAGGQTTINIDEWIPGERVYVAGVYLGRAWIWDNSNLLSVNLDLRSVNTEVGGELEVSSIEIQVYETTDYTDVIGMIQEGAPIWYAAGYPGDMSRRRDFYLSEPVEWSNNVLSVKGQDSTSKLDNELPASIQNMGSYTYVDHTLAKRLEAALSSIDYEKVGKLPPYGEQYELAAQVFFYNRESARSVISKYTGVYRDEATFMATYVDAGIPTLQYGVVSQKWDIYADEITDLISKAEANIHSIEINLPAYYLQYNGNIEEVEATSGMTYFVELDPPCNSVSISPTPTSSEQINDETFKFKAAATTKYTISGYQALENYTSGNDPYTATEADSGIIKRLDYSLPLCIGDAPSKSLTHDAIQALLNRSNIVYEFTYRGNPHIQPRDGLNVEIATWIDGHIIKTWETMTVDSITLEHSAGGGLTSKIRARKGAV